VLETINPQSVTALARNFFRDPTHIWPLHPDTLRFMMEMSGIRTNTILLKSPYPAEATLQPVEISPYLPARWRSTLEGMNDNIFRLNELLFGHQDYAIVGVI
jgi:O-antigen chain-terminating methyltransferase